MPPSASSALVNVAEDAELRLVRLLADSSESTGPNFVQDCESCIVHGDAAQLMRTIMAEQGAIAALISMEEEAVSAVSLLAALLDRVKNTNSSQLVEELANSVIHAVPSDATDVSRPISLLAMLYNMRSDPLEKVGLLVKMIGLAAARQPSLLETNGSVLGKWMDSSRLPAMLDEWNVQPANRRDLYRAAAEGAWSPLVKQQFTLLVVQTYKDSVRNREHLNDTRFLFLLSLMLLCSRILIRRGLSLLRKQQLGRSEIQFLSLFNRETFWLSLRFKHYRRIQVCLNKLSMTCPQPQFPTKFS